MKYHILSKKCFDYTHSYYYDKMFLLNTKEGFINEVKQCIMDILKYIAENANVTVESNIKNIVLSKIELSTLITDLSKDEKYQRDEIVYNLLKCHKYYLIIASISISGNRIIVINKSEIYGTTLDGEKFLNGELEL